ncbi:MAG: hypothetical protein LH473_03875 [Chitinophagales bacterium]|nr:hypothetical protein [Chitinophagales bacterium]
MCNELESLIKSIQVQAETGLKWFAGKKIHPEVSFDLYSIELTVLDNTIYFKSDAL